MEENANANGEVVTDKPYTDPGTIQTDETNNTSKNSHLDEENESSKIPIPTFTDPLTLANAEIPESTVQIGPLSMANVEIPESTVHSEPLSLASVEIPESTVQILSFQKPTPVDQHPLSSTPTDVIVSNVNYESEDSSLSDGTRTNNSYTTMDKPTVKTSVEPRKLVMADLKVPIVGYEVMEDRARFTVFKVRVVNGTTEESWFIYRRYTDFSRLNKKLTKMFPGMRFGLPSKRWFGDNFDPEFLEDRMLGLQAYVSNIVGNEQTCNCEPVREFFCLDEPPGAYDSLEETKTKCENLEEQVYGLQQALREKESEAELLRAELSMVRAQQSALVKSLSVSELTASLAGNLSKQGVQLDGDESPNCSDQQENISRDLSGSGDNVSSDLPVLD